MRVVNALILLVPAALVLGLMGLGLFLWTLRARQYDDLEGAASRILFDDMPRKDPPS
jgi:cbb3-type cytochrome oxidase maturation protein